MDNIRNYSEEMNSLELNFNLCFNNQQLLGSGDLIGSSPADSIFIPSENFIDSTDFTDTKFDPSVSDIDKWDYLAAASSAVIASALDILWVKDFSLENAQEWGGAKADEFVKEIARRKGYKGDSIDGAIKKLEELFKIPADELTNDFGGGKQHHLRDFTHHASLLGLCFSILTQFTGYVYGSDIDGHFVWYKVPTDDAIGKTFEEKIFNGVVVWAFHMISDFDGSSGSNGWGTGIPGPLLSFFKELSALPIVNNIKLNYKGDKTYISVLISKLFNGTYFPHETKDEIIRFDLRTEMGIFHQAAIQAVPVLVNECIVRAFYAIRRFTLQVKSNDIKCIRDLNKIDPKSYLPFNNRTIIRMVTVSSGTFLLIVTSEAAVKSIVKNGGLNAGTAKDFLLGINYPGVVRFIFACKADSKYLSDDMKKACQEFTDKHKADNQSIVSDIPGMEYLVLTEAQLRILASLERQKTLYDIGLTKSKKIANTKKEWLNSWESQISPSDQSNDYLILHEDELFSVITDELSKEENKNWIYLIAMELSLFSPYFTLGEEDVKKYKSLACKTDYEIDVFCKKFTLLSAEFFKSIPKTHSKAIATLNNTPGKVAVGAVVTIGATALTGGLAWAFAPEIAVFLAGESVAGLYGAALTSASLALVGGGSLAVGGLGMAGGTAIIAGGGALLGIASSGAATMSSIFLFSSKDQIMRDCAKLMTFSKCVLLNEYHNKEIVNDFALSIENGLCEIQNDIAALEIEVKYASKDAKKELKKKIMDSKTSLVYIERCCKYLKKLAK